MTRPIFEDPPDDMALRAGALLVNWNGNASVAAPEVSSAFRVAAERLLDAALANNETWAAAYPLSDLPKLLRGELPQPPTLSSSP